MPKGQVWMEGDEMFHSVDSNTYGPVPIALITSKVTYIVWPPTRAGRVQVEEEKRMGAVVMKAMERGKGVFGL